MAQSILSLDIREDVVCGVMLSPGAKGTSVVNCGIAVPDGRSVKEAIGEVLDQVSYEGESCRVSFGAELFFYRNVTFPFSDKRKIEKILPIELEENVIVDIDDLLVDSLITGKKGGASTVVAAMIDREVLGERLAELQELELDPEIVTISSVQTALQLTRNRVQDRFILLDIGCTRVTMFVMAESKMELIRIMHFDDGSLAHFSVDQNSQQVAPKRPELVEQTLKAMCREINHTVYALDSIEPGVPLYLTGALSTYPQTSKLVAGELHCEVMSCDLVGDRVSIGSGGGLWRSDLMTSALALGLRVGKKQAGFNFRKEEFSKKASFEKYKKLVPRLGVPAALILVFSLVYLWNDFNLKEKELNRLKLEGRQVFQATLPDVKRIVNPVQQLNVEIREMKKGMLGEASRLTEYKILDLLAEISVRIPESINVHVIRMVADRDGILLRGLTDNFNSVDNLKKILEKSDYFKSVTINSANLSTKGSGIRFELKVALNRG